MDRSLFDSRSPGALAPIDTIRGKDHAFLPNPLPPDWQFPIDLWPLLSEATDKLHLLEGFGRRVANPAILLRPLRDREAIRSSEIEGTYANPKQLLLLELDSEDPDATSDSREVLNYRRALQHAETTDLPLCLRLVRDLHRTLMSGVRGQEKDPGEFRKVLVAIGKSGRFVPPPPQRLMEFLDPFEAYLNLPASRFHKLVDCFLAHYQFETIHPFADGNGRVGRLLLSIMVKQSCRLTQPWLFLSEYFERNRDGYYQGLFRISTEGAWGDWIRYCLEGVCDQADATIGRFERLLVTKENYHARVHAGAGSARLIAIVDSMFEQPIVRVTTVRDQFGVHYNTAKTDVERLVAMGILAELPDRYPKTYYAPELFAIAYEGLDGV